MVDKIMLSERLNLTETDIRIIFAVHDYADARPDSLRWVHCLDHLSNTQLRDSIKEVVSFNEIRITVENLRRCRSAELFQNHVSLIDDVLRKLVPYAYLFKDSS